MEIYGRLVQHVCRAQDIHGRASQTDLEGTKAEGNKAGHDGLLGQWVERLIADGMTPS